MIFVFRGVVALLNDTTSSSKNDIDACPLCHFHSKKIDSLLEGFILVWTEIIESSSQ